MNNIIEAENLKKVYQVGKVPVRALDGVSFVIEKASFTSFVGPSGSGKSTLLNLIGCLDLPTAGDIKFNGKSMSGLGRTERARFRGAHLGFIFQDFNLMPVLTVFENAEYPLLMVKAEAKKKRRDTILALLDSVGMADQKDKFPDQLSGGQKQRVAIARALAADPELVLADEPTANLDHDTAYLIINLMKKMRDKNQTSFVFSTHDTKIVGEAEKIYTLEDGRLIDTQGE